MWEQDGMADNNTEIRFVCKGSTEVGRALVAYSESTLHACMLNKAIHAGIVFVVGLLAFLGHPLYDRNEKVCKAEFKQPRSL